MSASATWNPGDVVSLKSGGPAMTVAHKSGDGKFWCEWFVKGEVKGQEFASEQLEKASRDM